MWRMLTGRAQDLTVQVRSQTKGPTGRATWIARYRSGSTSGRSRTWSSPRSLFTDGLIADERDTFDFHAWAAMALGSRPPARLDPSGARAVRHRAADELSAFMAAEGARPPTP